MRKHQRRTKAKKQFKQRILVRDKSCYNCYTDIDLTVHHIISVYRAHYRKHDEANAITLCLSCHRNLHKASLGGSRLNEGLWLKWYCGNCQNLSPLKKVMVFGGVPCCYRCYIDLVRFAETHGKEWA